MTRRFLIIVAMPLLTATGVQADTFVYISVAAEKRISVYHLDPETGKLTHRSDCQVEDGEPGALTVDPEKRFMFASIFRRRCCSCP